MSLYREKTIDEIRKEYSLAAGFETEFERAKWGSFESMTGRFRFALFHFADLFKVERWLDIGCGEGLFFSEADRAGVETGEYVGLDVTPGMIERAGSRQYDTPVEFHLGDFVEPESVSGRFGLITMIGVLQQCGHTPLDSFRAVNRRLIPGGHLFLTTKHLGWERFATGELQPEQNHSWFRVEELRENAESAGLTVSDIGGLDPTSASRIPLERAHTLFLVAELSRGRS